jgi:hypothetical protein
VRVLWLAGVLILANCAPAPPPPVAQPKPDPTSQPEYALTVKRLAAMTREAETLLRSGKPDEAAAIVTKAQPQQSILLAAPQPTLAAMEAVSDLDQLYGRMLLRNGHNEWARTFFQKNLVRWKHWKPQTPETVRRFEMARAAIADCDRR